MVVLTSFKFPAILVYIHPIVRLQHALDEHIARAALRTGQQSQFHLDWTHAQCQHVVDGYIQRRIGLGRVFEALCHHKVVHAGRNQREQRLTEYPLW